MYHALVKLRYWIKNLLFFYLDKTLLSLELASQSYQSRTIDTLCIQIDKYKIAIEKWKTIFFCKIILPHKNFSRNFCFQILFDVNQNLTKAAQMAERQTMTCPGFKSPLWIAENASNIQSIYLNFPDWQSRREVSPQSVPIYATVGLDFVWGL